MFQHHAFNVSGGPPYAVVGGGGDDPVLDPMRQQDRIEPAQHPHRPFFPLGWYFPGGGEILGEKEHRLRATRGVRLHFGQPRAECRDPAPCVADGAAAPVGQVAHARRAVGTKIPPGQFQVRLLGGRGRPFGIR